MSINTIPSLPQQMLSSKQKGTAWKKENMDRLEAIGRDQIWSNAKLMENYEIIKGKFVYQHYIEKGEYSDLVDQLTQEFEIPSYLRHYDIISQVVNVLSGEFQKRPDTYRIKGTDEQTTGAFARKKTELLQHYVREQIENQIKEQLIQEGLDPEKVDFASPEEQQQYTQAVQERQQALTPPEIEKFMNQTWQSTAEIWGQYQLEADRQRFQLANLDKREFEDMLTVDRCFRHFFLRGDDYGQETWNPIYTFYHQSPEVEFVEDGDYAGHIRYLAPSAIINRYGWMMTPSEIKRLENVSMKNGVNGKGVGDYGIPNGAMMPWEDYGKYKFAKESLGFDMANRGQDLDSILKGGKSQGPYNFMTSGYHMVTEAYWQSQERIAKVTYVDPETGIVRSQWVDDTFIVPEGFTEYNQAPYGEAPINSVIWTWHNITYGGIKITLQDHQNPQQDNALYIGIGPTEFQFKGDSNPYGNKLPVCGQVFNNRNGESMSLVDLMKPHQIGYNVAMNQLYAIMQREIGRFMIMDIQILPILKDWGGEKSYEKAMIIAKELGVLPTDTSPSNSQGNAGHQPQMIDLDESARMMSRMKIAEYFEMQALKQIGFNPQRLGNTTASESATGVQQAVQQSFASTESYFTRFNEYKQRCMTMSLNLAQYVQSQKETITVQYTKSDMSRALMNFLGTDIMLADLGMYVVNSQEVLRQLEALRQLAMTNNTSDASMLDLATVITSNSPAEIKDQLRLGQERAQQQGQQQQQIEQQKIQQQQEQFEAMQEWEREKLQLELDNKKEVAYINTFSRQDDNLQDTNTDATPDVLEYQKFSAQQQKDQLAAQQAGAKQAFEVKKHGDNMDLAKRKMEEEKRKEASRLKLENKKLQAAKYNDKGSYKK